MNICSGGNHRGRGLPEHRGCLEHQLSHLAGEYCTIIELVGNAFFAGSKYILGLVISRGAPDDAPELDLVEQAGCLDFSFGDSVDDEAREPLGRDEADPFSESVEDALGLPAPDPRAQTGEDSDVSFVLSNDEGDGDTAGGHSLSDSEASSTSARTWDEDPAVLEQLPVGGACVEEVGEVAPAVPVVIPRPRNVRGIVVPAVLFQSAGGAEYSIRYNTMTHALIAYCGVHGRNCRKTKTLNPGTKSGLGRPIGFLAAWLLRASEEDCETRDAHRDCGHEKEFGFEERSAARHMFAGLPGSRIFLDLECPGDEEGDGEPQDFA